MGYAVELYFDEVLEQAVREVRAQLTRAGIRPVLDEIGDRPHISLAVFSQLDPQQMLRELEEFADTSAAMPITFGAIGAFATAEAVLFLAPVVTPPLLAIHDQFHRTLKRLGEQPHAYYMPGKWVPHCTVAQNVESRLVPSAFDACRRAFRPVSGRIVETGLVRFRPVVNVGCFTLRG